MSVVAVTSSIRSLVENLTLFFVMLDAVVVSLMR